MSDALDALTSNPTQEGTVTIDASGQTVTGGTHTVDMTATDKYGKTASTSFQFQVPDQMTVYRESQPATAVSGINVSLRFFADSGNITERFTGNNGQINLQSLPVEDSYVVVADPSDDWARTTLFIDAIYDQQEMYILNTNVTGSGVPTRDVLFNLEDKTGQFTPGQSGAILEIERPLTKDFDSDGSDETQYQIVYSDRFDATESVEAELQNDTRYRLRIRNNAGDERVLGHYTVTANAVETLTVGSLVFEDDNADEQVVTDSALVNVSNSRFIRVKYQDRERETSKIRVRITQYSNQSNLITDQNFTGTFGDFAMTQPLPASAPGNRSYTVRIDADRTSGSFSEERTVGAIPGLAGRLPVDSRALTWMGWITVVSLMGLVVVFDDSLAAIVGVVAAASLGLLGVITVPPVAIGVSGTIAVLYATVRRT